METAWTGPAGQTVDTPRHRALGSLSRVAILRLVRATPTGLTTGEAAAATGLHLSTVRAHLDRLVGAGLLIRERDGGGGPGRPAWRFRTAVPATATAPYRALAAALLRQLSTADDDGHAAAVRAGEGWGRQLAAETDNGQEPLDAVVQILDGLGFTSQLPLGTDRDPDSGDCGGTASGEQVEIHLHVCPFLDLVATDPDAMCGLHLGVLRGALAALDPAAAETAVLEPFGAPTACVVRLPAHHGPNAGQRIPSPSPAQRLPSSAQRVPNTGQRKPDSAQREPGPVVR